MIDIRKRILLAAYVQKSQVLSQLDRWREAEDALESCSQLTDEFVRDLATHQSSKISAMIQLGQIHCRQRKHEKAISIFQQLLTNVSWKYLPQVWGNLIQIICN